MVAVKSEKAKGVAVEGQDASQKHHATIVLNSPPSEGDVGAGGGQGPVMKGIEGVGATSTGPVIGEAGDFQLEAPVYAPKWRITDNDRFVNPFVAEEFIDYDVSPVERHHQRSQPRATIMSELCSNISLAVSGCTPCAGPKTIWWMTMMN